MTERSTAMDDRPLRLRSSTALWTGVAFSVAFTGLIAYAGAHWLERPPLTSDRGGFWYQWQLADPTVWSRATAWIGYLAHQCTLWGLIAYARTVRPAYTSGLHRFNAWALIANAGFIGLHFLQTQIWYDGLAQDVHVGTSQWSVIFLLIGVLIMENQRRGLVFGARSSLVTEAGQFVRQYHGYYFAWATVYTFWFHPMEDTYGHLLGFLYMFLMLLQGSLFFTRMHVNRYWTLVQEVAVTVHGTMVAWLAGQAWQMFAAGFLAMFVLTQMHGLGFSRGRRWAIGGGYIAFVAWLYAGRGFGYLPEILSIPATLLGGAVVGSLGILLLLRAVRSANSIKRAPIQDP